MSEGADHFLRDWHSIVATKDFEALAAILDENVTLGAPPYWGRLEGRALVAHLLGLIIGTIEDFTYHREWEREGEFALEFTGHVDGLDLQAIDLITLDSEGLIQNLDVLMRPLNAVTALRDRIAPQMAAYFASTQAAADSR